ncbi:MAG: hypothetical protein H8D97_01030 [Proteobacteria bacterium]|nr:hypothetical protein [Pseudomonadota bacterium]
MFVLPPVKGGPKRSTGPVGGGTRGFRQASNTAPVTQKAPEATKTKAAPTAQAATQR